MPAIGCPVGPRFFCWCQVEENSASPLSSMSDESRENQGKMWRPSVAEAEAPTSGNTALFYPIRRITRFLPAQTTI